MNPNIMKFLLTRLILRMRITIIKGSMIIPIMATNITHPAPDLYLPKSSPNFLSTELSSSAISDMLLIAFAATAAHISRIKDSTYSGINIAYVYPRSVNYVLKQ